MENTLRKLATIQKVVSIKPIAGADRVVEAQIMGWAAVVKKGEFNEGDLCLFFEVDSVLPEAPWSEFMRPRKFRVKTAKLRGVLSQGLVIPLAALPVEQREKLRLEEGFDATEILGVKLYAPPIVDTIGGHVEQEAPFPSHIPKTDEERVQSRMELLEAILKRPFAITVKIDGSSMTVTYDESDNFFVCSRNFSLKFNADNPSKHWILTEKYQLKDKLRGTSLAIQGELCGPGIQLNRLRLTEPELLVFNIFDWKARLFWNHQQITKFCAEHGLKTVPVEETGTAFSYTLPELLTKAEGLYTGTQNLREGIVIRSLDKPRISFKVLSNEFLLKED